MRNPSFIDKESYCQFLFDQKGPFWHIATPGNLTEILFTDADDYRYAQSQLAIGSVQCGLKTYSFQLMANHLHDIVGAPSPGPCIDLLDFLAGRIKRYSTLKGRHIDLSSFVCEPLPITSLQALRNNIVYTHRNKYVVDATQTPFSYPWGSGGLYFGEDPGNLKSTRYNDLTKREQKLITSSRIIALPDWFTVRNGCVTPESFCDWRTGRSFFRDAHQYFNMLGKNYEAYAEFASLYGDTVTLTDEELYSAACQLAKQHYNTTSPSQLADGAKKELAKKLHFDHHAGNNQLRRILKMDPFVLESMFPQAR